MTKPADKGRSLIRSDTICVVPRWQLYKQSLTNLEMDEFLDFLRKDTSGVLLDVRTPVEFSSGHIPGALNIDYLSPILADILEELDDNKSYYVYCRTGRRSLRICMLLKNLGRNVFNLNNGIKDVALNKLVKR